MLLVCDIGNTNTVFGLFDGENLKSKFRIATKIDFEEEFYFTTLKKVFKNNKINEKNVDNVVVISVVKDNNAIFKKFIREYFKIEPVFLNSTDKYRDIKNNYENPESLGIDRLVNAVGAFYIYKNAVITVDMGTATTIDILLSSGEFIGGIILIGMNLAGKTLNKNTSLLPEVNLKIPTSVIGKNTQDAILSGLTYGHVYQIDSLVNKIKEEYPKENFKVIFTGGLSFLAKEISETCDIIDEDLTLKSLRLIFNRRNKNEF